MNFHALMAGALMASIAASASAVASANAAASANAVASANPAASESGASQVTPAPKGDLDFLERRWHKCVRQAFSGQPAGMAIHAAQKAALAECKPLENEYVSAMLVAQAAEAEARRQGKQSIGAKARGWASSLLSYVVEPVSSWIDAWRK